jgi:hypothetical protein
MNAHRWLIDRSQWLPVPLSSPAMPTSDNWEDRSLAASSPTFVRPSRHHLVVTQGDLMSLKPAK